MDSPRLTPLTVDWQAAAATDAAAGATPVEAFAPLNAAAKPRFPGIAKSAVPVLLPFDIDGFRKARAAHPEQTPDAAREAADNFVLAGFHASKFFLAGPAGYDAAFSLRVAGVPGLTDIDYRKPVHLLLSGFALLYDLGGPPLPEGEPVKDLQDKFPGIRRILLRILRALRLPALWRDLCGGDLLPGPAAARALSHLPPGRPHHHALPRRAASGRRRDPRRNARRSRRRRSTGRRKRRRPSPISAPAFSFPAPASSPISAAAPTTPSTATCAFR